MTRAVTNWTQAAGPLVAAFAFDLTASYVPIFTVFIGTNVAAALLVGAAKPPMRTPRHPPSARC